MFQKAIIDKYPKLVVRLATHEKMTTDILFELAEKIRKLSINLRSVSQGLQYFAKIAIDF